MMAALPALLLFCFSAARGQTLKSAVSVTTIEVSAPVGQERLYVVSRADSSAEVLWPRAADDVAVWTSLLYDAQTGADTRRVPDFVLQQADRTHACGFVGLPHGAVAMVSAGEPAELWGIKKYLREFDQDGQPLRDVEIPSGEVSGGGFSPRADDLSLGFRQERAQLEYNYWGETTGGGHYGSRGSHISFANLEKIAGNGGCSHNLAGRAVWNHEQQLPGQWCMQDGFGGVYQWNSRNCRTYAFRYDYGYATKPLGDVVPYKEGFILTLGAQRNVDGRENARPDAKIITWSDPGGNKNQYFKTDVGLIFQPFENKYSMPCCVVWITDTPDKMESSVHAGWLGPNQEQLVIFYVVHDSKEAGGSATSAKARYMMQKLNPEPIRQYYLEWMSQVDPPLQSYAATCPVGCGDLSGKFGSVLEGPAEEVGDLVHWREHQTFTSFPNGDIGWAATFATDATGAVDHNSPEQTELKLVRVKYTQPVAGGWTEWGPCDCVSLKRRRACAKPVAVNGGAACSGTAEEACDGTCADTTALPTSYPFGHDPVLQDPSGAKWFQNSGGCPRYLAEQEACHHSPNCCGGQLSCIQRDADWAGCLASCTIGLHEGDPNPWSCEPYKSCFLAHVRADGGNGDGVRTLEVPSSHYECPAIVNKDNWLTSDTGLETFRVNRKGSTITVTRKDDPGATWGLDLQFNCCVKKETPCTDNKCGLSHGTCVLTSGECKCSEGYTGAECQLRPGCHPDLPDISVDQFSRASGASVIGGTIRSNKNAVSTATLPVTIPLGYTSIHFGFQWVSGYCKQLGKGTAPIMALLVDGQEKWRSVLDLAVEDYPWDRKCGGQKDSALSYSPEVKVSVDMDGLVGDQALVWQFTTADRNMQVKWTSMSFCSSVDSAYWAESGFEHCSSECCQPQQTLTQTVSCKKAGTHAEAPDATCEGPKPATTKICRGTPPCIGVCEYAAAAAEAEAEAEAEAKAKAEEKPGEPRRNSLSLGVRLAPSAFTACVSLLATFACLLALLGT